MSDLVPISIIIPCRNEKKYIGRCLDSIVANDYPKDRLEVLVIDGISEDGTREIVERYTQRYPFIRLLDNPKKITPVAFNLGIKSAEGELIMIMSAHATYEREYISKCVKFLSKYNADNVGGIMITIPRDKTLVGKAIALALSHRFGVGGSNFRVGSKEPKWVDTVFGGCYRKEVFEKIGLFNEDLASSQDMEFNLRLKRVGGKTLLVPEIVSYYYARSDFRSFCRNNFRNGVWAIYPLKFVSIPFSWRHYIPFAFVASLIGSLTLSIFSQFFLWLFLFILGSYSSTNIYLSVRISAEEKNFKYSLIMPVIFATLHISYGLGSIWGAIKLLTPKEERL